MAKRLQHRAQRRRRQRADDDLATQAAGRRLGGDAGDDSATRRRRAWLGRRSRRRSWRRKSDPPAIRRRPRATFGAAHSECPFGGGFELALKAMNRLVSPSARGPPRRARSKPSTAPRGASTRRERGTEERRTETHRGAALPEGPVRMLSAREAARDADQRARHVVRQRRRPPGRVPEQEISAAPHPPVAARAVLQP